MYSYDPKNRPVPLEQMPPWRGQDPEVIHRRKLRRQVIIGLLSGVFLGLVSIVVLYLALKTRTPGAVTP